MLILFVVVPLLLLAGLANLTVALFLAYRFRSQGLRFHWTSLEEAVRFKDPRGGVKLRTFREIFVWWEARRPAYNVLVGGVGLLGTVLLYQFFPKDVGETKALLAGLGGLACLYGLGANVGYSLGWIVEGFLSKAEPAKAERLGPLSYSLGLGFAMILTIVIPLAMIPMIIYNVPID